MVHKVTAGLIMVKKKSKRVRRQNNSWNQKAFSVCMCNGLLIGYVDLTYCWWVKLFQRFDIHTNTTQVISYLTENTASVLQRPACECSLRKKVTLFWVTCEIHNNIKWAKCWVCNVQVCGTCSYHCDLKCIGRVLLPAAYYVNKGTGCDLFQTTVGSFLCTSYRSPFRR